MTALLVDGPNVLVRALKAMERSGLQADGVPTGALLTFINSVSKHVREERPDRLAICWDGGRSLHRVALDPGYKAHRHTQPEYEEVKTDAFSLVKEFCALAGLHSVERRGYEADDLIAYYWRQHRPLDDPVVILSSDKDFLQLLVPGQVEQVRVSSASTDTDRWTAQRVEEVYGCPPKALPAVMALMGDVSDGVVGVRGIGPKTAVKLLRPYHWEIEFALDPHNGHPRLLDHAERIKTNLALVDLRTAPPGLLLPPLPEFQPTQPDSVLYGHLLSFLSRYQMESVKQRLYSAQLWGVDHLV